MGFKIGFQIGEWGYPFQNTIFTWSFKNHAKSKVFQTHKRQQAFFSKFDVKLGSRRIHALTLSLRGPAQFTHEAWSAELVWPFNFIWKSPLMLIGTSNRKKYDRCNLLNIVRFSFIFINLKICHYNWSTWFVLPVYSCKVHHLT